MADKDGDDINDIIQQEINKEILKSIKISNTEWWSPDGKGVVPDGPVIDFKENINE